LESTSKVRVVYLCVGVSILPLSKILIIDFGIGPGIFCVIFFIHVHNDNII
jgi:hypothetical protein